jgi:1,4-dihydroxy-6-naphthoate synthase
MDESSSPSSSERLRVGISTCPNDTFAFHGLLSGAVQPRGFELALELHDVQELNEGLAAGAYDAAKGSFHAALELADELCVLRVGAALGFGNGPLLLAPGEPRARGAPRRVLAPGRLTTATLLMRLFHPEETLEQVLFSEIQPALRRGEADLGVCIHEGRFTWEAQGLRCLEDLGERWQERTGAPLPLGGIFARRRLGAERLRALEAAIAASIAHARRHPREALVTMRRHAQEQSDAVLEAHVQLYVNEHTEALGPQGVAAIARLAREARRAGLLDARSELEVCGG